MGGSIREILLDLITLAIVLALISLLTLADQLFDENEEADVGFNLIYLDQNGEERVYDKFHYRLYNEAKLDKVCSWTSGHNNFGHYNNTLYVSATALWLVRNWQPTPPYSWQETEVYVLDDESDDR